MIRKTILVLCLLLGSQAALAQQGQSDKYVEGIHYHKIDQAPTATGTNRVEVTEVFSYACSHCNTFEPYMQSWKDRKPEHVTLNRLPVVFGRRAWEMMARGYITAEMMGIEEQSHIAMMDAVWRRNIQFRSVDQLADFYSGFGVEKDSYLSHYNSFAADSQLRRGQRDVQLFGITGTPTLVVNRKYRITSSESVPTFEAMLAVVDFLVAKETVALTTAGS